ncbi:MAG: hypothetical protein QXZ70_00495 [Candidatus Bathyarchaeia archaeon]
MNIKVRMLKANDGKTAIVAVLAIALVLSSSVGIFSINNIGDKFSNIEMRLEEGIEIIKSKSYSISSSVKWTEIKAAGIKTTETSLKGFLQICERIAVNLGNFKVYADFEARVMWVYDGASNVGADSEVYYLKFT